MKHAIKTYVKDSHVVYDSLGYLNDEARFNSCFEDWAELNDCKIVDENAIDSDGDIILTKEQFIECYLEDEYEFFKDWYKSVKNPYDLFVTGQLGLWNGTPTIMPRMFKTMEEAINACADKCDYIKVELFPECIKIEGIHHDGTNRFEIRMMNKKGQELFDNSPIYDEEDALMKIAENKKYQHTLYEEMFWVCL